MCRTDMDAQHGDHEEVDAAVKAPEVECTAPVRTSPNAATDEKLE